MSTLAADKPRVFETGHDEYLNEAPAVGDDIIYEGAAVGDNASGYARPLVGGDVFKGFATERCDNTGGANGAKRVKLKSKGVVKLSVAGVTGPNDVDELVYASDDDTYTLTASGGSPIGRVFRHESGTVCLVAFQAKTLQDQA